MSKQFLASSTLTTLAASFILMATTAMPAAADTYSLAGVEAKLISVQFESQMEVEDIIGTSHQATGSVTLDDKAAAFKLEVPVASLRTGIDLRDENIRSDAWLDAAKFPTISFAGTSIVKSGTSYKVSGTFTMRGKSKPVTVTADVREIAADDAKKLGLGDSKWVRIRSAFTVQLSDFGIKIPGMTASKVNNTWTVKVSLFAKASTK
ncbi:MAG: YceI family protein [Myxococcales bacterium]|nr:YceI family protein [Myxococcales bacterium]